jgi:hypothetical protein
MSHVAAAGWAIQPATLVTLSPLIGLADDNVGRTVMRSIWSAEDSRIVHLISKSEILCCRGKERSIEMGVPSLLESL